MISHKKFDNTRKERVKHTKRFSPKLHRSTDGVKTKTKPTYSNEDDREIREM